MAYDESLVRSLLQQPGPGSGAPPKPPSLTEKESGALERIFQHFSQPDLAFPSSTHKHHDESPKKALSDWEKCYTLSRESSLRALRADKWDVAKAIQRLEHTVVWRREAGMADLDIMGHADVMRKEGPTGKLFVLGFDHECRPILHMRPRHQNTTPTADRLVFTFWTMDRVIDIMPSGVEKMTMIIDLGGPSDSPQIKQQMEFIRTLSSHYNERLGRASLLHMPLVAQYAFKIIRPLIDPVTYAKLSFDKNEPLRLVPAEQLDAHLGGTSGFEWDAKYWDVLIDECRRRRNERLQRWHEMGGRVGLSEWTDYCHVNGTEAEKATDATTMSGQDNAANEKIEHQPTATVELAPAAAA